MRKVFLCAMMILCLLMSCAFAQTQDQPKWEDDGLRMTLPDGWTAFPMDEVAAKAGLIVNASSPDGAMLLQVFELTDGDVAEMVEKLSSMATVTDLCYEPADLTPYVLYTDESGIVCYVQAMDRLMMIRMTLSDPALREDAQRIIKGIVASIPISAQIDEPGKD